jgi:acyl-CoA thioester hydrolase
MAEWLELSRGVVHPWHHDHFGHMNVRHYAPFFDDASYQIWTRIGLPYGRMLEEHGVHCVTASATTTFLQELMAGTLIVIDGAVTRVGTKSAGFRLRMLGADTGVLHATSDMVEVVFDPATRSSAPMPGAVRTALEAHLVNLDG